MHGVRILSMAWMFPGPYCVMLLADLGADVVMLERPGIGDPSRQMPDFFPAINRNKRSVTVDLSRPEGRDICHRLAARSDVVTEGFRPGVAARLGIDYAALGSLNPGLIYASITGYGQDGPYRNRPGHDLTYQGVAGMLAGQEERAGPPAVAIADLSSAMFAAIGILAALWGRERTGRGQYIDVSMTDGLVSWMSVALQSHFGGGSGQPIDPGPAFGVFEAADGRCITLSLAPFEGHFWQRLCQAIGRDDLADLGQVERMVRQAELVGEIRRAIRARPRDEWVEILAQADVPAGPVLELHEVARDPHLLARGLFVDIDTKGGRQKQVAHPVKFSSMPAEVRTPPPALGEHTDEVLREAGYSVKQIEVLRRDGII